MVQVSAGSTYDPSLVPNLPAVPKASGAKPKNGKTPSAAKAASMNTTTSALPVTKREIDCCGG